MKKIEVKEYEPCEQLVIVYELEKEFEDMDDSDIDFSDITIWRKIDLYDPMLKYNSGVNIGYRGEGPATLGRIIVETFREYDSAKKYTDARNRIEDYLASITNESVYDKVFLEKDVKHLL